MPKIDYIEKNFRQEAQEILVQAEVILEEYAEEGFTLTLRQLYYQFVARDLIENTERSYKRLGSIISDGRMAGWIDWDLIVDRTRNLRSLSHWRNPQEIILEDSRCFRVDLWEEQSYYCEVWIEKDALIGVIEDICNSLDVPFFSCRGYCSQSEVWAAAQRFRKQEDEGQETILFHLGDHDPSGIDMTNDIQNRMEGFFSSVKVKRLALNMDQINQYNPPPNPAKVTDSRFEAYQKEYGEKSWELDALTPQTIITLIDEAIREIIEPADWSEAIKRTERGKKDLRNIAGHWLEVQQAIHGIPGEEKKE